MESTHYQQVPTPSLPPRRFWLWAIVTVVGFLLCYFIMEKVLWDIGWYTFSPLYPVPADDPHLIRFSDQVTFFQGQVLVATIPTMIFALALVVIAAWRRNVEYTVGPLLGLLLGGLREYTMLWQSHFGGYALGPGLQLADHTAHSMFAGLCVFVAFAAR